MATAAELERQFDDLIRGNPAGVASLEQDVRAHIERAHRRILLNDGSVVSGVELREGRAELERLRYLLRRIEVYVTSP